MRCSSWNSCSSLTELAVGLTEVGCCAAAGTAVIANIASANIASAPRRRASIMVMPFSPPALLLFASPLRGDGLLVGGLPAPGTRAVAALDHPLLVDLRDHLAVAGEQRLGRAHLGAQRQLAVGQAVRAVALILGEGAVDLRAAGAEGALVHLAARAEVADLRILRRAERAGVEAVAAADAEILRVQHDAVRGRVEAVDRAHRRAGRVGAVHAGHR